MTVDEYVFKLGDSGVLLNTDISGLPFVDITRVQGLDSPQFRETYRDHEGNDGGFLDAEFEKGRDILLEGTVYATTSTIETYLDSLKYNYKPVQDPIPFYFNPPGIGERLLYVKSRGVRYDWDTARRIGMTSIQFMLYAEDPRIYTGGNALSTTIAFGGSTGVGLAFSFGFNVDFGGGSTPAGANVTNSGNRPAPVVIVITGPVTNPVVGNTTSGRTLRFNITLGALDTLTIDTLYRTVYLNGNINRRNTLTTPEWFYIEPGTNQIFYGGLTGTGSSINLTFRSAWR